MSRKSAGLSVHSGLEIFRLKADAAVNWKLKTENRRPQTANRQPPTANRQPQTGNR